MSIDLDTPFIALLLINLWSIDDYVFDHKPHALPHSYNVTTPKFENIIVRNRFFSFGKKQVLLGTWYGLFTVVATMFLRPPPRLGIFAAWCVVMSGNWSSLTKQKVKANHYIKRQILLKLNLLVGSGKSQSAEVTVPH